VPELEFYELDPYITALMKDDKIERERCLSTTRISTIKKVLVVYPFKIKVKIL
jgi:hypothetical protein